MAHRIARRLNSQNHRLLEQLESRLLLTAAFTPDDVALTWNWVGMAQNGTVQLDDANNVTATTLNTDQATVIHPTGTYSIGSGGGFDMTLTVPASLNGAVSANRSAIALSEIGEPHSLSLMLSPASGATGADIKGTWGLYFNGDAEDNSGLGTITFDDLGNILSGSGKDSSGTTAITGGSYTVNPNGTVNVTINVKQANGQTGSNTLAGVINSTKDLIALNPTDFAAAATDDDTRLFVLVKHSATYVPANVTGFWTISGDQTNGSFDVDAAGNLIGELSNGQGAFDLTGKVTVTSTGSATLKINASQNNVSSLFTFTGTMNNLKDIIVANFIGGGGDNMTVFTRSGNHIPTLTTVATLGTANAAKDFSIPFATLAAAGNEADLDGDAVGFQIISINNGTLTVDGVTPVSFPYTVNVGDPLVWTPDVSAKGKVAAFTIRAFDGSDQSASNVQVFVNVNAAPVVTITAKPGASENNNGTTKGVGAFTFARSGSNTLPLDIAFTIDESGPHAATNGDDYPQINTLTVHFDAGKSTATVSIVPTDDILTEGTETVTFALAAGTDYTLGTKTTAVISIADYELAPEAVTGACLTGTVTSGTNPFASKGFLTIAFGNDNTNYILFGQNQVFSSSGTFTYSRTTSTTGTVTMIDTVYGNVTATLTFSSTSKAKFDFASGGGEQHGTASYFIPKTVAPASIDGRTFSVKVTDGIAPSESTGAYSFTFSEGSALYAITGTPTNIRSHGSFAYQQFSPNAALISTNDSVIVSTYALLFTSATKIGFFMSSDAGGAQAGTMTLAPILVGDFTPTDIKGVTIAGTASAGVAPLKTSGKYTIVFDAVADTYTGTGGFANANSTGTDVYTVFSGRVVLLDFSDTVAGDGFMIITFSSATKATYYLVTFDGQTQKGTWTLPS